MFVVDTNVLVYAADRDSPHHSACLELLEFWRGSSDAWFLTWTIAYEFLRVVSHPRVLRESSPKLVESLHGSLVTRSSSFLPYLLPSSGS
jgi:predicted nucleic acid-binding protein